MCSHKYLTIKPVYTTLCLYTKNTKDPPVFFHKTLRFISEKKILMCSHKYLTIKPVYTTLCLYTKNTKVFTKHYDSYLKKDPHVFSQILNYKTCLYNFVSLHKKYQRSSCVFSTKHYDSYPSNYKTCLYNFVSLHKNTKDPPVFFHKTLRFISILMCSHKYLTIKPVYTTLCLYIKNTKVFTKHYDSI